jgi:4-amino-4-deoxy-L-arabinose transferase-like glycosyltransferase
MTASAMSTTPLVATSPPTEGRLAATFFLGIGALLRILSYSYSENTGGDAGARVALTARWLQHLAPKMIFDVYEPGHFWLMGAATLFVHDVTTAGRLLSLVLGIASLFIVWQLARVLYGETAAISSLAVFSLYSLHIGYSVTSSAEVSYLFFLLLAIQLFFLHLQTGPDRIWYLWLSGCSLSISESIRYEAWTFFFAMFLALTLRPWWDGRISKTSCSLLPLFVFGTAGGAWPMFMMIYSWHRFGHPMYLVTLNTQRVHQWLASTHPSLARQLALSPAVLMLSLSFPAFVAACYSLIVSFRSRLAAVFVAMVVFFGLIQTYQIIRGGLEANSRYTLTLGTMFAVLSGYGIEKLCQKLAPLRVGMGRAIVFGCLFLNLWGVLALSESHLPVAETFAAISPRLRYSRRIASVGQFLRTHRNPQDAVAIDDYNVESNIVADAAGLPLLAGNLDYLASKKNELGIIEYIDKEHPRFLVYSDQGTLQKWIPLPGGCEETTRIGEIQFACEFSNQIYRVYELSYQ